MNWWPREDTRPVAYVYHTRPHIPKRLTECISGKYRVSHVEDPFSWTQTDFYVMVTALNHKSEAAAARVGLFPIVLPQMSNYLAEQISKRQHDVYIFLASHVGEVPPKPLGKING